MDIIDVLQEIDSLETLKIVFDHRAIKSVSSDITEGKPYAMTATTVVTASYSYQSVEVGPTYVRGEEHPALVALWDNDDDAIYDQF